jgi:hypothetical protein
LLPLQCDKGDARWRLVLADNKSHKITTHQTQQTNINLPDPSVCGTVSVVLENVCRTEVLVAMHGDQPKAVGLHILTGLFPFVATSGGEIAG